jgi:putative phage-type endonuclease
MVKKSLKDKINGLLEKYPTSDKLETLIEIFVKESKNELKAKDYLLIKDIVKNYTNTEDEQEICNVYFDNLTSKFEVKNLLTDEFIYSDKTYKDNIYIQREKQFEFLKSIPQYEQRSDEWFEQRESMITASDIGTAIDLNHYQKRYSLILKKCDRGPEYKDNKFVHHGKKYEEIATMIYELRYNIKVEEFGLIPHPLIPFIGASPDGICTKYTLDGKLSKLVGRMLEIKCPFSREIKLEGEIYDEICPAYYWAQVQIQLEVCNLDECDFWQCRLEEYKSREEFIEDTDPDNMYLSKTHGQEKGCVIQLLPKENINEFCLYSAKYIYPPKINMSPKEYDDWILNKINNIWKIDKNYVFDKVIYWKLTRSKNVTIYKDINWLNKVLPTIKETWDFIKFYRNDDKKLDQLCEFIEKNKRKKNNNELIINYAYHQLNNIPFDPDDILSEDSPKSPKQSYITNEDNFIDTDSSDNLTSSDNKKSNKKSNKNNEDNFIDTDSSDNLDIFIKEDNLKKSNKKSKIVIDKKGGKFYKSQDNDVECMLLSDSNE